MNKPKKVLIHDYTQKSSFWFKYQNRIEAHFSTAFCFNTEILILIQAAANHRSEFKIDQW